MPIVLRISSGCCRSSPVRRLAACVLGLLLAIPGWAGDFEKTPEYFTNVYGLPDATRTVSAHAFRLADDVIVVKGRFSVREYHGPDLVIEAVFNLPQLTLAGVTLRRPRAWTYVERDDSFAAYGSRWRRLARAFWLSSDGVRASYEGTSFHFISPEIVGASDEKERSPGG
jgi:hypothetical protein